MHSDNFEPAAIRHAMWRIGGAVAIAFAILVGLWTDARPAQGRGECAAHGELASLLAAQYSERPIAIGLTSEGTVIQVYARGDGQTWTITATRPDGLSCLVAVGEAWETIPAALPGQGA